MRIARPGHCLWAAQDEHKSAFLQVLVNFAKDNPHTILFFLGGGGL